VRIIHGTCKGALKKAITEMLAEHAHVSSFTEAEPEKGGAGVTVVQLKRN